MTQTKAPYRVKTNVNKGIPYPSAEYALRQEFVSAMRRFAKRLNNIEKAKSRIQYKIARMLIDEWASGVYADELTKDDFYCEASRVICDELGFALVSTTGETVKVWVEVFQQFENTPETLKEQLPFEYFRNARWLTNKHLVAVPMVAIATALDHKLTAAEMKQWYLDPPIVNPLVLEYRKVYPDWMWGIVNKFPGLNGELKQVQYHMNEIRKLVEAQHADDHGMDD